jgi:hypothetical protein
MKSIFSAVNPSLLLHIILNQSDFQGRQEIIPDQNFLQLASIESPKGQKFLAHRHLPKVVNFQEFYAQESWVVIQGAVKVTFFDIDNLEIDQQIIKAGEVSVTLLGGHAYEILEDAKVLEFKTGPYFGKNADKIFI